jgi:hypothetical protein
VKPYPTDRVIPLTTWEGPVIAGGRCRRAVGAEPVSSVRAQGLLVMPGSWQKYRLPSAVVFTVGDTHS